MKKVSSRSQRGNKGIKGKHVVQICVLVGVCIWLIYQVKYSHDKKKEFYEKDDKKSTVSISVKEDGLVKLGRKDLLPRKSVEEEDESKVEEEEKEEEEEVVEEEEEDKNKHGEEVVEEEGEEDEESNKHEEEDEIDEQDRSKVVEDTDKEDESVEEEKEKESENHGDEIDMTFDEAREEHYKADDASSAVSHESRVLKTEKLDERSGNSTETGQESDLNVATTDVKIQTEPVLKSGEAESGDLVEKTATEAKDGDRESSNSEGKSAVTELRGQENNTNVDTSEVKIQKEPVLKLGEAESGESVNKTATEVKDGDRESSVTELRGETVNGNSTEAILEASRFLHNETEIMRERSHENDKTEDGASPLGSSDLQTVFKLEQSRNESDHNMTVSANITSNGSTQDDSKNSTSESALIKNISGQNTTEVQENSRSDGDDETEEKESSDLFATEQIEEADDTSETTMLQEEKEALTDTQTLPDIKAEGNEDDEEDGITSE